MSVIIEAEDLGPFDLRPSSTPFTTFDHICFSTALFSLVLPIVFFSRCGGEGA